MHPHQVPCVKGTYLAAFAAYFTREAIGRFESVHDPNAGSSKGPMHTA